MKYVDEAHDINSRSVLVVEDDTVYRNLLRRQLESIGCDVVAVNDDRFALSAFETRVFDIVFMDIQMPVMNGLQATRSICEYERQMYQSQ